MFCHKPKIKCLVFFKSARRVCNHLNFNSIKTALKSLNFFKKMISAFLNPKMIEISTKEPLNLSLLECTYLGKNIISA